MSLAKGLGGGVPIGAIVAKDEVARGFAPGAHASTFGGNPLAMAAALTTLEVIEEEHLLENVQRAGEHLATALARLAKKYAAARARGRRRGRAGAARSAYAVVASSAGGDGRRRHAHRAQEPRARTPAVGGGRHGGALRPRGSTSPPTSSTRRSRSSTRSSVSHEHPAQARLPLVPRLERGGAARADRARRRAEAACGARARRTRRSPGAPSG